MAMEIAAGYWGFRNQTPNNYFHIASELGLSAVEVPMYEQIKTASHLSDHERWDYRTPDSRQDLVDLADEAGVEMVAGVANIPIDPELHHWKNDADHEFAMASAKRAIDIGADLGLEIIRIAEPVLNTNDPDAVRSSMESVGAALRELGEYARSDGIEVLIENHALTSEQVNMALNAADHPAVGTNYDPHNYYRTGEDPVSALRNLDEEYLFYCHLKDAAHGETGDPETVVEEYKYPPPVPVGDGHLDWAAILSELATFYDGYLAIEHDLTADVVRGTRRSIDYIAPIAAEHSLPIE